MLSDLILSYLSVQDFCEKSILVGPIYFLIAFVTTINLNRK